jgi:hypothetical protein
MDKTSFNLSTFMGRCKTVLPGYFLSLNELNNSKQSATLAKNVINDLI